MKKKNIFKSVLAAALALIMVFGAAPLSGLADIDLPLLSLKASAKTTEDGVFEYEMNDSDESVRITHCDETAAGEVVVPETVGWVKVTRIDSDAFKNCTEITSIVIPESVTAIGAGHFSGCSSLANIKVSEDNKNYSSIDGVLFNKDGSRLLVYPKGNKRSKYIVPVSATSIDSYAFYDCTSLTEITIPDSVTSIGSYAFSGCTSLSKVQLSNNLTVIECKTFYGCTNLKDVTIPDGVTEIGDSNYGNYGGESFSGCTSLKEITIPDSVTTIVYGSFSNCTSLESVTLGSGVKELGDNWILNCRRLADITVSPENSSFSSVDGVLFNKDGSSLLAYPIGNKRSAYTIPDGVEKVGAKAFYGCRYIESLTIPASVTEIEASALGNCYDIRAVYYSGTREQWKEVVIGADNYMFALINVHCADDTDCTHEWGEWKVVEKATAEKEGLEKRTCSLCNAEETRKIPKLDIVKVTEIVLSDSEKTLTVGKSFTVTANVKPDDAFDRTVTWSSSDPSVATVDENGTVTAIAEGEVIITAESADGVKAECRVTVEKEKESFGKTLLNVITAPFRAIINLFKKLFGKSI